MARSLAAASAKTEVRRKPAVHVAVIVVCVAHRGRDVLEEEGRCLEVPQKGTDVAHSIVKRETARRVVHHSIPLQRAVHALAAAAPLVERSVHHPILIKSNLKLHSVLEKIVTLRFFQVQTPTTFPYR